MFAVKQIITSEKFQKILSTPEHLEAESQVRLFCVFSSSLFLIPPSLIRACCQKLVAQKIEKVDQERAKLSKSIRETKEIQKRLAGKLRLELGEMKEATLHLKSTFKADLRTACGHLEHTKEAYKKLVRPHRRKKNEEHLSELMLL